MVTCSDVDFQNFFKKGFFLRICSGVSDYNVYKKIDLFLKRINLDMHLN